MILKDPKVLSVLPLKKRGEKGWRELQGDSLRELLLELIRKEVVTIWNVVWKVKLVFLDTEILPTKLYT